MSRLWSNVAYGDRRLSAGAVGFIIISIVLFIGALLAFALMRSESRFWPGWYVMEVSHDISESQVLEEMHRAGLPEPVSSLNSTVAYMAVPSIERISVSEIDSVLPPGDFRRDSYISGVSGLFKSGKGAVVYVPADRRIASYRKAFTGFPALEKLVILDEQPCGGFKAVILFGVGALLAAAGSRRQLYARISLSLIWMPFVYFAYPGASFFALLMAAGSPVCFFLGRNNVKKWRLFLFLGGYLVSLVFLLIISSGPDMEWNRLWMAFTAAAGSEITALLCVRMLPAYKSVFQTSFGKSEHTLFEPVPLKGPLAGKPSDSASAKRSGTLFPALAASLLLLFLPHSFFHNDNMYSASRVMPVPGVPREDSFSFNTLSGIFSENSSLPDLSELLASYAYQESVFYGGKYKFPVREETLKLISYRKDGFRIKAVPENIIKFDETWLSNVISHEKSFGIGQLLISLGGPAGVFAKSVSIYSSESVSRLMELIAGLFIILLFSAGMPADFYKKERIMNTSSFRSRRRGQAA